MAGRRSFSSTTESDILIVTEDGTDIGYVGRQVAPNHGLTPEMSLKNSMNAAKTLEYTPPEGRHLYFEDGRRRIDFVLCWEGDESTEEQRACKDVFERHLMEEGLQLEHDIKEGRELQFTKIHAPWEVLSRYAEIMKIHMPIKETPDDVMATSFWQILTAHLSRLLSPFSLDPTKVPPLPKKFTHAFERDKQYLFAIPKKKEYFFSHATRSLIVDFIIKRKNYSDDPEEIYAFGITRLISNGVYSSANPLHEGSWKPWTKPSMRRLLYEHWAHWKNFYREQPLDYIRIYLGEKIALYFAWVGFYTWMLIVPSIVGLIVFIYGLATINDNIVAEESCNQANNFTMCPACVKRCPYWNYADTCTDIRASHMFDNPATVAFAAFMSLWGTVFLEFWKRKEAVIQFKWNVTKYEEEEEPPRPEYLTRVSNSKHKKRHNVTGVDEPYLPFWTRRLPIYAASVSTVLFLVLVAIAFLFGIIVYRMAVRTAIYLHEEEQLYRNAGMVTSATGAVINLLVIFVLNFIYGHVAGWLTDWEHHRVQSTYDRSLTIKLYALQFVTYYSSIFYIAFFKGRFVGHPGDYYTLFDARQEECSGGGCLMDLCIQLAITFVGKQLIKNNMVEIFLPKLKRAIKGCCKKEDEGSIKKMAPWEKDEKLDPINSRALYKEYNEMLVQYGFVTLFVAAFPLAPLFALLNNVIEIRSDANKFAVVNRRPVADRTETIGVWYHIMFVLSRISTITNGFIIAVTSSFIHRMVYQKMYSPDGSMRGFVDNSLSYFNVSDFPPDEAYEDEEGRFTNLTHCRYMAYREPYWSPDKYAYTKEHWHVTAAQFVFVLVFENVILTLTSVVAYVIPDVPRSVRDQIRREKHVISEMIMKTELDLATGKDPEVTDHELRRIRRWIRLEHAGSRDQGESSSGQTSRLFSSGSPQPVQVTSAGGATNTAKQRRRRKSSAVSIQEVDGATNV